jgi:hypothetical protein
MPPGLDLKDPHSLMTPETRANIPPEVLDKVIEALSSSIVYTFSWAIIPAVLALLVTLFMGRKKYDINEQHEYTGSH